MLARIPIVPFRETLKIIFLYCTEWQSFLQPEQENNQYLNRTANKTLLSWQETCTKIFGNVWKKLSKIVLFKGPYIICWSIDQNCTSQASKYIVVVVMLTMMVKQMILVNTQQGRLGPDWLASVPGHHSFVIPSY